VRPPHRATSPFPWPLTSPREQYDPASHPEIDRLIQNSMCGIHAQDARLLRGRARTDRFHCASCAPRTPMPHTKHDTKSESLGTSNRQQTHGFTDPLRHSKDSLPVRLRNVQPGDRTANPHWLSATRSSLDIAGCRIPIALGGLTHMSVGGGDGAANQIDAQQNIFGAEKTYSHACHTDKDLSSVNRTPWRSEFNYSARGAPKWRSETGLAQGTRAGHGCNASLELRTANALKVRARANPCASICAMPIGCSSRKPALPKPANRLHGASRSVKSGHRLNQGCRFAHRRSRADALRVCGCSTIRQPPNTLSVLCRRILAPGRAQHPYRNQCSESALSRPAMHLPRRSLEIRRSRKGESDVVHARMSHQVDLYGRTIQGGTHISSGFARMF